MVDRVGQQLGNYRLVSLLGQGGFADVYLGEHIHLNTQAAIKVLQIGLVGSHVQDFLTEARTIAVLTHPNIVRVLDFGVEDNVSFLVMDYAPKGTLRQRYPSGTQLPPVTILPYIKQVASALQYAHDRKLIHRDVKPENILLGADTTVLLSDFGLVLEVHRSSSQLWGLAGTLPYMAPEQLQRQPCPATDQYALGIIAYELLCGERPFQGMTVELVKQQISTPPPPLREKGLSISPAVEQVVLKALAKVPQQRFESIEAFALAFEQACQPAHYRAFATLTTMLLAEDVLPAASLNVLTKQTLQATEVKPISRSTMQLSVQNVPHLGQSISSTARHTLQNQSLHLNSLAAQQSPPGHSSEVVPSSFLPQARGPAIYRHAILLGLTCLAALCLVAGGVIWLIFSQVSSRTSSTITRATPMARPSPSLRATPSPAQMTPTPPAREALTPTARTRQTPVSTHRRNQTPTPTATQPPGVGQTPVTGPPPTVVVPPPSPTPGATPTPTPTG